MATLYWSPNSPYVKKVVLALRELGLENTVINKRGVTGPTLKHTEHDQWNPSGKVPTLVLEGNRPIFGSQVIMQYLDSLAPADKRILPPAEDTTRYDELVLESLADALLDAALLCRYEVTTRPEELRWQDWIDGQMSKMHRALPLIYARLDPSSGLYQLPDPAANVLSYGGIAIASACWYLDKRFPELDWRAGPGAKLATWYSAIQLRESWRDGEN